MGAPAQIPQPGDTVAGKYLLESLLGRGGMGAVFRARHTLTDRKVALKWMLPDEEAGAAAVQRFLREARAMGRIDHPSVVGVLDVGVEGDAAYLVMELLRGSSLRDKIEASGKLSPKEAIGLLLPAMEGLAAAHAAGVVHRDIKPDNLFCVAGGGTDRPVTKVLDFGVSKLQGDRFAGPGAPGSGSITHTGAMVGTPAYMAPEQVRGERNLDARTDVWALGAILYEALSGKLPFDHETLGQTIVAIATMAPPRLESHLPGIDVGLADAVHRALEKDLGARWPTVEAFANALLPYGDGSVFVAPRPTSVRPAALESTEGEAFEIPRAARVPTTAGTMASGTRDPNDVHVSVVAPSSKTSTTSATPFVSSSANRVLPTNRPPWGWIAGIGAIATVVVGGALMAGTRETPSLPTPVASAVPAPIDAGTDAFVVAIAPLPPLPTLVALPEPPPTQAQIVEPRVAEPRVTRHAPRVGAPPPTVVAPPPTSTAPAGGRTGRLSRDDF